MKGARIKLDPIEIRSKRNSDNHIIDIMVNLRRLERYYDNPDPRLKYRYFQIIEEIQTQLMYFTSR